MENQQKKRMQQNKSLSILQDLMKSDLNALTHIDLQLKNCTLSNEQVAQLNNCLVQCQKLESLVLNLNKENISDDQINQLFAKYHYIKDFVETGNNVSNDQKYTQILFFLNYFQIIHDCQELRLNDIVAQGDILLEETMSNLINLNSLQLNLDGNQLGDQGSVWICKVLHRCKTLNNLNLQLWKNKLGDRGISSIAEGISSCTKLTTLTLNAVQILLINVYILKNYFSIYSCSSV
ncbi:kinase domain protein (macronuclear) [Tetrahymena thermophila SB210]|uniref:Kinase domain protein n=1 Tax=Tetrahymena thermophila (strain SB210) TaxID=312017 RepID=Q239G0_TETTS|nr:kinase domain protein [Tetrahymena thermophila SB210]EAR93167.2 kinase domain protein [Tetrahymena thermophila SB210]|eukprot:XP_001013412.2 kinase domain protein [Tetrahymena thermophila SB210]